MYTEEVEMVEGLDTTIDWKNTGDNSYDGEKLKLLVHDESGKWERPNNILNNWRVTKTCLRLGSKIIGKCMMGSTSNSLEKGGDSFKKLFYDSDINNRNANGQTKSGLYSLFIPMEWNMEGFIDRHGMPVFRNPKESIIDVYGDYVTQGAIDYWENEVESLKNDPDALNEFYRQFPRSENHAFRDESKQSLFNLQKIYQQIDYNESLMKDQVITRGSFSWKNGIQDTEVIFSPNDRRFMFLGLQTNICKIKLYIKREQNILLMNTWVLLAVIVMIFLGTVGGGGSNGALHGMTKFHMDEGPTNEFFFGIHS